MKRHLLIWLIIAIGLIIFICYCLRDYKDTLFNYDIIDVGEGHIYLPKKLTDNGAVNKYDNYVSVESPEAVILGLDYGNGLVGDETLDMIGISQEQLRKIAEIRDDSELKTILAVDDSRIIKSGHVNKPSFDKYLISYTSDGKKITVGSYTKNEKCLIEIIKTDEDYLTDKQLDKMFSGISF